MIIQKQISAFILLLSLGLGLVSCGGDSEGNGDDPTPTQLLPQVRINMPQRDTLVYTGVTILFTATSQNQVDEYQWAVNGTPVEGDRDDNRYSYSHNFNQVGEFTVSISVTNERGTIENSRVVRVENPPISREDLLTGGSSKRWNYDKILLNNQGSNLLRSYETDNSLVIYKDVQVNDLGRNYRLFFDPGSNRTIPRDPIPGEEQEVYGNWQFLADGRLLELRPIFSDPMTVVEITETNLVISIRSTNTASIYYYFKAN
ncbi:MAG: hypothetical protein JJT94_00280 [Bernardetiaceae bacterium]|nr:hypothetical protein [Bernardetiaceae bacterium]